MKRLGKIPVAGEPEGLVEALDELFSAWAPGQVAVVYAGESIFLGFREPGDDPDDRAAFVEALQEELHELVALQEANVAQAPPEPPPQRLQIELAPIRVELDRGPSTVQFNREPDGSLSSATLT